MRRVDPVTRHARTASVMATLATLLALAGCATSTPESSSATARASREDPQVVPPSFGGAASARAASAPAASAPAASAPVVFAAEIGWERFFTDPALQSLIRTALEHNRDLRVATLNVEQARAQVTAREADLWPTLNAALGGARVPTNSGGTSTTVSGGLTTAAFELDLFGRVRQSAAAAQAQFQASRALQRAARSSLIAAVATAYFNVQADAGLLRLTEQTLRSRQEGLETAQRRAQAGAASALDVAQAQALLEAARAARAQVQRQKVLDESALALLVGRPIPSASAALPSSTTPASATSPTPSEANAPLWNPVFGAELRADLPSTVLAHRPDLQAAEAQLGAAQANLEAARAALFPRITLTTSLGQASRDLSGLLAGGTWVWGVAPQLVAPLFDAGRNRAGVAQATAAQQAAVAQYEKALQVAFKEVGDALAARGLLDQQQQALAAQVQAEQARAQLAETRWKLGASAYLDVLDAQRSLYAAQTALIQVQTQVALNQATLYRVLGGGAN